MGWFRKKKPADSIDAGPLDRHDQDQLKLYRILHQGGLLEAVTEDHKSHLRLIESIRKMSPDHILADRLDRMELQIYRGELKLAPFERYTGSE